MDRKPTRQVIRNVRGSAGLRGGEGPDAAFVRGRGVAYRYVLRLRDAADAATLLGILADVSIPPLYLLLLPAGSGSGYTAYVGLASADVLDLPIRLASQGIRIERGEETGWDSR